MARVDYDEQADVFDAAQDVGEGARHAWRDALRPWVTVASRNTTANDTPVVVDLGAGTGQWSSHFRAWFGADMVAVEPSSGMRYHAYDRANSTDWFDLVGGEAEHLPLRDQSIDVVWLSTVVHHIGDLGMFADEVKRVLRPGGRVLFRGRYPDSPKKPDVGTLAKANGFRGVAVSLKTFFPGVQRIYDTFPTIAQLDSLFGPLGLGRTHFEWVPEVSAARPAVFRERVALRADSTLTVLNDIEFEQGMRQLDIWVASAAPEAVLTALPLLVYS